eukprot:978548_1
MATEQYAAYNREYGYPPKEPEHLIAFAKKNGVKVNWREARNVIERAPNTSNYGLAGSDKNRANKLNTQSIQETNCEPLKPPQIATQCLSPFQLEELSDEKSVTLSLTAHRDRVYHDATEYSREPTIYEDITFKWTTHALHLMLCDHYQLLYVVSLVIDALNREIQRTKDDAQLLYNKTLILGYLRFCKALNGVSFQLATNEDAFVHHIKQIVFDTKNANDFSTQRLKQQYAHHLYDRIKSFDMQSIAVPSICHICFTPAWIANAEEDESLTKNGFDIISTLNQYKHSSYLTKLTDNTAVIDALKECNHKISSILCNKWMVHIKAKETIWHHTIQSVKDCTVLNMMYLLDCVLRHKLDRNISKTRFKSLASRTAKLVQFFEDYGIGGTEFAYFTSDESQQDDFVRLMHTAIDPKRDLTNDLNALCQFICKLNLFKITIFHIKHDLEWDLSVQSIQECKEKDILYILVSHLLYDPSLVKLRAFKSKIVEYFVRQTVTWKKLGNVKEEIFVDRLNKFIKSKQKTLLIKLYYAIKRCQIEDMITISMQQRENMYKQNKAGFVEWHKRTNFRNIERVGYKWSDGVIVVADVISDPKDDKLQLRARNIGKSSTSFWVSLPNDKLCELTKEVIEQSHHEVFNKWMMILRIKNRQNSCFEASVFRDMVSISQTHPQLLFTVRHSNYAVKLEDKTYDNVLQSIFASALVVRCRRSQCHDTAKLNCYCDVTRFQTYTYYMMMVILTEQSNASKRKDTLLRMLKTERDNMFLVAEKMCAFLPPRFRQKESYFDRYKKHILRWLLHDFYHRICSHCGNVNKSIMRNRVFYYSSTLRHCRTCGVIVSSTNQFKSIDGESQKTAKPIIWFCHQAHKDALKEENIKPKHLDKALTFCIFNDKISAHDENELLNFLQSLLHERFDELTYYLSHFLDDIHNWKALRIKITANYYFIGKKSFVPVQRFMRDAGIHPSHIDIFKDCWSRGLFQTVKDNPPLIHILQLNNAQDEQKTNRKQDALCVDYECLQIFRKLTPSIADFTARFIQCVTAFCPANVDLFPFIKRFVDFKIDDHVLHVISPLDLLSLLWNKWECLSPPTYPSSIVIKPLHASLRDEILNELSMSSLYFELERKAHRMWSNTETKSIKASKSEWNAIAGVKPGTPISMKYIHVVLLFAEVPALRDRIRRLLAANSVAALHQRFGHLFKLLKETVYLYGNALSKTECKCMYYSMDESILLDNYRAMINIPIIGCNKPVAMQKNTKLAQCYSSTLWHCFNLTSIYPCSKQDFYIFFGGSSDIHSDSLDHCNEDSTYTIHSDIIGVFTSLGWLDIQYSNASKKIKRMNEDLLVIIYDKWCDIQTHFGCDRKSSAYHPFMEALAPILKEHNIQYHPQLMFRINTLLTYYQNSKNVLPDFDTFITETKIHTSDHLFSLDVDSFRERYCKEIANVKKHLKQRRSNKKPRRASVLFGSPLPRFQLLRAETDPVESTAETLADKLYDVGIFMRYDVNNPRFESLAEETMFNEVVKISNERFNQHLDKAREIHAHKCFIMLATADDVSFGIEKYQPISMCHILAIIIHTEEPKYSRAFIRSCLLLKHTESEIVIQTHCRNFYWFGRYLYECIQYFGEILDERSATQQMQRFVYTFKFDLFAPQINFARST